ncbi:SDR family NAD(P)-dependent oxidoreductase [Leucobacter sp. PH1c]|uniref:SDR family NAD(P)-dependent oxidoreductase n=1 Tax=Leucobacter sp. PH1c TaxID=1397278 RepID=UPI00046839BB|nr:SDR family oxidoreductase [Leucobacter sp. PH1c]
MTLRYALITGASSGIGTAAALALAADGNAVWLTYTGGEAAAREAADACIAAGAPEARVSRLDLRDPASIDALVAEVEATWGRLHVLVNNGGVCPYRAFDDITIDEWDAVMETNGRGTFLLTRAALPLLRAAAGTPEAPVDRAVVNLSSIAGQQGALKTGMHYAASKGAILALTRSFARHLAGEGIRVNAVTPGPVVSAITNHLQGPARDALTASIPLGDFGQPEDVAWIIAALASPKAAFTTGATYDVNGGVRID